MIMNVQVEKSDIMKVGHTLYDHEGYLAIVCDVKTCNIEEILLRTILKCFGDDYKIVDEFDTGTMDENGNTPDVTYVTNLPYTVCESL